MRREQIIDNEEFFALLLSQNLAWYFHAQYCGYRRYSTIKKQTKDILKLCEAGKIKTFRHLNRGRKPGVARATGTDTEFSTIPAHGGYHARPFNITHRVHDWFTHGHGDIQKELIIAADKRERFGKFLSIRRRWRQGGWKSPQRQARAGNISSEMMNN